MPYPEILEVLGFPVEKHLLDILTKIRSKKLWYGISKNYNIPNKEYRSKAKVYTDDEINLICKMISNNKSLKEIADALDVDLSIDKEYDKFSHFIKRIKDKKTYTNISNNYF